MPASNTSWEDLQSFNDDVDQASLTGETTPSVSGSDSHDASLSDDSSGKRPANDIERLLNKYFAVYLSNVPENATVKNIHGAVRSKIGKFRSLSSAFMKDKPGTCQLILKHEATRKKLIDGPIMIFGVAVHTSIECPTSLSEAKYYPVYLRGLPDNIGVKKLLGLAKKVLGEFVAMNRVTVDDGQSKITFQNKILQSAFLEKCFVDELKDIEASLYPFARSENQTSGDETPGLESSGAENWDSSSATSASADCSVNSSPPAFQPAAASSGSVNASPRCVAQETSDASPPPAATQTQNAMSGIIWMNIMQADGRGASLPFNVVPASRNTQSKEIGKMVMRHLQPNGQVLETPYLITPAFPASLTAVPTAVNNQASRRPTARRVNHPVSQTIPNAGHVVPGSFVVPNAGNIQQPMPALAHSSQRYLHTANNPQRMVYPSSLIQQPVGHPMTPSVISASSPSGSIHAHPQYIQRQQHHIPSAYGMYPSYATASPQITF